MIKINRTFSYKAALFGAAMSLALGMSVQNSNAQTVPPEQTGIASPDRIDNQFQEPKFRPSIMPKVEVREIQIQQAPEGAEDIVFDLSSIQLEGVTVYQERELVKVYQDRLGSTITLADLYVIAAELTRKYRNDGYILTQVIVPPQTIEGGIARLQIVEGRVDNIEVRTDDEDKESTSRLVRDYVTYLGAEDVLNARALERALLLINDLPGVNARAILSPSANTTGASDLLIILERTPYTAEVGINNFGTRFLGPVQASGSVALNSFFGNNERITAQTVWGLSTGEFKELMFFALRYDQPISSVGTTASFFGSYTNTEPGFTLDEFDVIGHSQQFYAQIEQSLYRSRSFNMNVRAMFDYREVTTQNNVITDPTRKDHIRALRVGGNAEFLDTIFGLGFNAIDIQYSRGFNIMGATSADQDDVSRPGAGWDFNKFELTAQRLQRITSDVDLLLSFSGQLTDNAVLSSEEFTIGGINRGRGYDNAEAIGDDGFATTVELQWDNPYYWDENFDYEVYTFFDAGRVFDNDATAAQLERETLTSTGMGVRADIYQDTNAGLMIAWPLNTTPQTQDDRGPRLYFNLSHSF